MAWRSKPNRPNLDATKIPTPIDIAWAAGIYEGEGSCRLTGRRGLDASVPQKEPEILYRLRDWFGGAIGNPSPKNPCYKWNICGDRCRIFLSLIYSFLSAKRRAQVDAAEALVFLGGKSPEGLSQEDLALHLAAFYEERRADTWYGVNRKAVRRANYEKRKNEDPNFLPNLIARNQEWRGKQGESWREYQKEYQHERYLRKKAEAQCDIKTEPESKEGI